MLIPNKTLAKCKGCKTTKFKLGKKTGYGKSTANLLVLLFKLANYATKGLTVLPSKDLRCTEILKETSFWDKIFWPFVYTEGL